MIAWLRRAFFRHAFPHAFRLREIEGRAPDDLVRWPCVRCGRPLAEHP